MVTALGTYRLVAALGDGPMFWEIAAPAYVLMWIRRLNPKADRVHRKGQLHISATVDKTAELEWIRQRYPLDPSDAESAIAFAKMLATSRAREASVRDLLAPGYEPRSFELVYPPREYQRLAADMFLRTGNLLLVDAVGLGKTVTTIAALTDPSTRPAVVVTLAHLTRQWKREFTKFAPTMRALVLTKGTPYRLHDRHDNAPDVVICNYHKLVGWEEYFTTRLKPRAVIFDEVQELRRDKSAKWSAARAIAHVAERRLGLSATPVYNYGSEMYSILDVLSPGTLGDKTEFHAEWCNGAQGGSRDSTPIANPAAFGSYLRAQGVMLVRSRSDVGRELPALSSIVQATDSDTEVIAAAADSVAEMARIIASGGGTQQERFAASAEIDWRLREATGVAKAEYVCAFVSLLCEAGERVVLYGWHHKVYDIWRTKLAEWKPAEFHGDQSLTQKDAAKDAFTKGDARVLIMSLRAGAGLDGLQHCCRTVVFGELDWSPAVHEQAAGRVHRDGQPDPVMAYYCLSDEGSDPVIADALGLKEHQSRGVRLRAEDAEAGPLFGRSADAGEPHIQRLARMVLEKRGATAKQD